MISNNNQHIKRNNYITAEEKSGNILVFFPFPRRGGEGGGSRERGEEEGEGRREGEERRREKREE